MKKIMRFLILAVLLAGMGMITKSGVTAKAENDFHSEAAKPAHVASKQPSANVWQTVWSDGYSRSRWWITQASRKSWHNSGNFEKEALPWTVITPSYYSCS